MDPKKRPATTEIIYLIQLVIEVQTCLCMIKSNLALDVYGVFSAIKKN